MIKMQLDEIRDKIDINKAPIVGDRSTVFTLLDGRFLKKYDEGYLAESKSLGADIEKKILDSANRDLPSEIIKPEIAVYDRDKFVYDVTNPANGISYGDWEKKLTTVQRSDLSLYASIYSRLERIVKSTPDIVYPDLCSYDNIFVSDNGKRVELIDYEGFQVGEIPSLSMSSALGERRLYNDSSKYCRGANPGSSAPLYTKELDIRSLFYFYFRMVFNVDLNMVAKNIEYLDDVLQLIEMQTNLKDPDIMHKVWKLFQEKEKNEWLGDDVFRVADEYRMDVYPNGVKRLVRR